GVAVAVRPDLRAGAFLLIGAGPGVIVGDGAVVVEAEDLAVEHVHLLGEFLLEVLAGGDVELAVGPELDAASGVIAAGLDAGEDVLLLRDDTVLLDAADDADVLVAAIAIGEIEVVVGREAGVDADAHEADFAAAPS